MEYKQVKEKVSTVLHESLSHVGDGFKEISQLNISKCHILKAKFSHYFLVLDAVEKKN